jgi:CTP:molybdopterin cytidylyltransferase MocA
VPLLAAAVVALLLSTGISLRELGRSRERADALAVQLLDQQRRLVQLETSSATSVSRIPPFSSREAWLRTIEDRPRVTVEELRELLAQLPDDFALLGPQRTRELGGARWVPSPWREAFEALPDDAGATAADLRNVLDRIGIPEGASVPTRRLLDLLG